MQHNRKLTKSVDRTSKHKPEERSFKNGAASIFIVIFATILITTITVGFIKIMIMDKKQSINNDLGKSANDSALAGIEMGKILLTKAAKYHCSSIHDPQKECKAIYEQTCDTIQNGLGEGTVGKEVPIGPEEMQQAFTCLIISPDTLDFIGLLEEGHSEVISLNFKENTQNLRLSWFSEADSLGSMDYADPTFPELPAHPNGTWNRPSLMRAQLIQNGVNIGVVFLYPSIDGDAKTTISSAMLTNSVNRNKDQTTPIAVQCAENFAQLQNYACSVELELPEIISAQSDNTLLRLTSYYRRSNFQVQGLASDKRAILFNGVQPEIDSTGRANDIFRRVVSRVGFSTIFDTPDYAIEMGQTTPNGLESGDLCKDFVITNEVMDGVTGMGC